VSDKIYNIIFVPEDVYENYLRALQPQSREVLPELRQYGVKTLRWGDYYIIPEMAPIDMREAFIEKFKEGK
jgi:hypothetical protein